MRFESCYTRAEELRILLADLTREVKASEDYLHLLHGRFNTDDLEHQYKKVRQRLRVKAKDLFGLRCWHPAEGPQAQTLVITLTMANFMLEHLPTRVVWELQPMWAQHHLEILGWDKKFLNQAEEELQPMTLLQRPTPNADLQAEPIEHRTYIYDREASTVSDDEIFEHIQHLNNEIKKLEAFETKPKKLEQRIEKLQSNRDKLVKYVDSRS